MAGFFAVEHARGAGLDEHFRGDGRALDDAAARGDVAEENGEAAGGAVGILDRPQHLRIAVGRAGDVLRHGLARHGDELGVDELGLRPAAS